MTPREPVPPPSRSTRFLAARLEARDENGFWLALSLLLGLAAAIRFLVQAHAAPGGIQSDAMMFLSWMGRWDDPSALMGDLVADYWQSVTPWFFQALFKGAWQLGIGPHAFARLLPAMLFVAVPIASFRFLRSIGAEPLVAFAATALLLFNFVALSNSMASATPRSLWPLLLLLLLDGLARRNIVQSALTQGCLAGCYPQLTLVTSTMIGMTLLQPRLLFLDLAPKRLLLVGACGLATVAGLLPFVLETGAFSPVVTLAEARTLSTFGPEGRNVVFEPDGSVDLLCGRRVGLFQNACHGTPNLLFVFLALAAVFGPVVLLRRWLRSDESRRMGMSSELPFLLLLASLAWFVIAASTMFRLHLPSRYSTALVTLAILTTFPLLVERIRARRFPRWLRERRSGRILMHVGTIAVLILAFGGALGVKRSMLSPDNPELVAFVRSLPPGARVAGFVTDLDFSPVLTNRSTLFSRELTIGYQLGYLRPILARMADIRDAILTNDPVILADRLRRNQVDVLLIADETLRDPKVPERFRGFFQADELKDAETQATVQGLTALSRSAADCTLKRIGRVWALDAPCLMAGTRAAVGG
ncbi:hypothetical protein [Aureimonas psammosilenae]|uniref:hypothetical protein n=1 Tax=Aureimonas psammosilenae TaxID=2495496 RepID=UPI001260C40D|nr:hypothetical protein [Aureimonas psammosilenae]